MRSDSFNQLFIIYICFLSTPLSWVDWGQAHRDQSHPVRPPFPFFMKLKKKSIRYQISVWLNVDFLFGFTAFARHVKQGSGSGWHKLLLNLLRPFRLQVISNTNNMLEPRCSLSHITSVSTSRCSLQLTQQEWLTHHDRKGEINHLLFLVHFFMH